MSTTPTCACDNSADPAHTECCECPCHLPPPAPAGGDPGALKTPAVLAMAAAAGLPVERRVLTTTPAPAVVPADGSPMPALDFGKLSPQAVADARDYKRGLRYSRGGAALTDRVIASYFGLSATKGHLGLVPDALAGAAFGAYARIFRAICGDTDVRVPDGELPRTSYRIRIGRKWLASLVCKPGGAVLTADKAAAGLFDGPVRLNAADYHGPGLTTGLARNLLQHEGKVWCEPVDGGPGFWMY